MVPLWRRPLTRNLILLCTAAVVFSGGLGKVERLLSGVKPGVSLEGVDMGGMLRNEVVRTVKHMAAERRRDPIPARIDQETGQLLTEVNGVEVDIPRTVEDVISAPRGAALKLRLMPVEPPVVYEDLVGLEIQLGEYSTYLMGSWERMENIRLSTRTINNTVIMPGEVFSFNEVVGPRTYERGYKPAPVIVGEAVVLGEGGGVCQTSSTLYNAALESRMEIVERHPHGLPVSYVPPGRDATVSYGDLDMRFRNNRNTAILIKGEVRGHMVHFVILGKKEE